MTVLCEKKAATIFSQLYTISMATAFQMEGNKYSIKHIKHVGGTPQFQKTMSGERVCLRVEQRQYLGIDGWWNPRPGVD